MFLIFLLLLLASARNIESSSTILGGGRLNGNYRPCLVQLFGEVQLKTSTLVPAVAARLSISLAKRYAQRHGYAHYLYDCAGAGYCSKPPSIADACFSRKCTHVFYIDTDVLIHQERLDIVRHLVEDFNAPITLGIDYYQTQKNPKWHNGTKRIFRTDSNAGMAVVSCQLPHTRELLLEWERLCRRFSPTHDDQEAITLVETLPQFGMLGMFARDGLFLGQYSLVARHFPGDRAKKMRYPLPSDPEYTRDRERLQNSGLYKWVDAYWRKLGYPVPDTEKWRISNVSGAAWEGVGMQFKQCPMKKDNTYVDDMLFGFGFETDRGKSLDGINENSHYKALLQ